MIKKIIFILLALILVHTTASAKVIKVGAYYFAPFVEKGKGRELKGLTIDIVKAINSFQKKYQFKIVLTSPRKRYRDLKNKKIDMLIFESISWGWKKQHVHASNVFLKGGEVYVALAKKGRNQNFFSSFRKKKMVGILGYHYGFANFNSNPKFLKKTYNMYLTNSNKSNIRMILKNKVDIAVVTKSYLDRFFFQNPQFKKRLLVSKKLDQAYQHTMLIKKGIRPDVKEINKILTKMKRSGELAKIWKQYGITQ
ncbi:MAG: polar amino acid transport system substrate-binding protein [bacterium]|jgi:polar amino acid transport system substrate-binding protein